MLLVSHTAIGAAMGYITDKPIIAFLLGLIFHFIGDFIPHGDNQAVEDYRKGFKSTMHKVITADILITFIYILIISIELSEKYSTHNAAIYWGIIGGLFPDFLVTIYEITQLKLLKYFYKFHFFIHDYLKDYDIPLWISILGQGILLIILFKIQF